MDAETAALLERARRLRTVIVVVALATLGHLLLVIAILAQVRGPGLPGWVIPLFLSLALGPIALVVLRTLANSLEADAAKAEIEATLRILDELDDDDER